MAYTFLSQRLATLPLVLAGPILRRVEKTQVSVWIALKAERQLKLVIYDSQNRVVVESPMRSTIKLGVNLHMLLLTAELPSATSFPLATGEIYSYGIFAQGVEITPCDEVTYQPQQFSRPTFTLPPASLNDLRIVHGSCRKMHAPGEDAFVALHQMLEDESCNYSTYAQTRPHQLFLTGDQIYADDVDALLLYLIRDASRALLGWEEEIIGPNHDLLTHFESNKVAPGMRASMIRSKSGFKFPGEPEVPANHLIFLGEYYCMYLLMWSPVLWPVQAEKSYYPTYKEVYPIQLDEVRLPSEAEFDEHRDAALLFQQQTKDVRRALANVPTYMICDDHEITDDWFITMQWTRDVLSQDLGRRILTNGMTAYALFQAWGNTPDRFEPNTAGGKLLEILPNWNLGYQATNTVTGIAPIQLSYYDAMYRLLGLPDLDQTEQHGYLIPANPNLHLWYNYHIVWDKHEVFVLDTRNHRAYPGNFPGDNDPLRDRYPPVLIRQDSLESQLDALDDDAEVTFIVVATPVSGVPNAEEGLAAAMLVSSTGNGEGVYRTDYEMYAAYPNAVQALYGLIAQRVSERNQRRLANNQALRDTSRIVLLSGDVHYGFTNRIEFWADRTFNDTEQSPTLPQTAHFVLAQLCASALKNELGVIKDDAWSLGKGVPFTERKGTNRAQFDGYTKSELENQHINLGWVRPANPSTKKIIGTVARNAGVPSKGVPFRIVNDNIYVTRRSPVLDRDSTVRERGGFSFTPTVPPDWAYRVNYLTAVGGTPRPESVMPATPRDPMQATLNAALNDYLATASNARNYMLFDGPGREAVGKNNLGEIRFSWGFTEDTKIVRHQLWWRMEKRGATNRTELDPFPLSSYEVILGGASQYTKPY